MLGTDEDPGIMVRALNDLFLEMEHTREKLVYKVTMSYLEVSSTTAFIWTSQPTSHNTPLHGLPYGYADDVLTLTWWRNIT